MTKKNAAVVDLSIVPPTQAACPRHGLKSHDFVSLNTKKEPVFRCVGTTPSATLDTLSLPHYFTAEREPVSA